MNMRWLICGTFVLLTVMAGCSKPAEEKEPVPIVDQPRPSSTTAQIIEDMTGKTDVKAGLRAEATIRKVKAQENKDLDEVMK
jgi:hypothetical protein